MTSSVDPHRLKLTNDEGTLGVLVGVRCRECGVPVFGPATFCQACTSTNLAPVEFASQGTLYSYTVVRVPPSGWPGPVPYILGEIELPEGPHVLAEVVDAAESDLRIGIDMELALRSVEAFQGEEEVIVYKWRPQEKNKVKQ